MKTCPYCHDNDKVDEWCVSRKPGEFGVPECTRKVGHEGDHVACGYFTHEADRWKALE